MDERRDYPRNETKIALKYSYQNKESRRVSEGMVTLNVSKSGLCFSSDREIEIGTVLILKMNIIDETISCKGEVVRSNKMKVLGKWDIGIVLNDIDNKKREKLVAFSHDLFNNHQFIK